MSCHRYASVILPQQGGTLAVRGAVGRQTCFDRGQLEIRGPGAGVNRCTKWYSRQFTAW